MIALNSRDAEGSVAKHHHIWRLGGHARHATPIGPARMPCRRCSSTVGPFDLGRASRLSASLWLSCFESGDRLGGGASYLDQQPFVVVDLESVAVSGDGYGLAGMADADADALSGDHDDAPAADPAL